MSWQPFDITGFQPDIPSQPGSVFEVEPMIGGYTFGMYPTASGIHNGPFPEVTSSSGGTAGAMEANSVGSKIIYKTDGSVRIFIGTPTKIWELTSASTITDRSGGAMLATTSDTWSFAQFGDISLAVNRNDFLQKSTTGAFSAVGAAPVPKASIVVVCGPVSAPFAMVFDYADGVNTYRDGWFNSAISDPSTSAVASWTTGTGGCANGRLLDDLPGPITAAIAYRDGVVAWKPQGMYLGSYDTKLSAAWSWERISSSIGCLGKNCAVAVDDLILFADSNGLWMYDGSYPRKLPGAVHNWWAQSVARYVSTIDDQHAAKVVRDKKRRNVWFFLPSSGLSNTHCMGLVYHLDSQKWMPWSKFVDFAGTIIAQDVIGMEGQGVGAFMVSTTKKIGPLTYSASGSNPPVSGVTFGVMGDNMGKLQMKGLRLCPLTATAASTAISAGVVLAGDYWRSSTGVVGSTATGAANGARLAVDITAANRFLQPAVSFAAGIDIEIAYSGGAINLTRAGDN